ncbi:MAG: hypothetical protein ACJA1X_001932 [Bermanella sp.]|jgi:hypothetical protein
MATKQIPASDKKIALELKNGSFSERDILLNRKIPWPLNGR